MRELPRSSKYVATPAVPVDEVERDHMVERLNEAFTVNAVDGEQYRELLDGIYAAHTLGDLADVERRLPLLDLSAVPSGAAQDSRLAPGQVNEVDLGHAAGLSRTVVIGSLVALVLVLALMGRFWH